MQIKNNRNFSFLFMVVVAGIVATLIYYTYLSYGEYKEKAYGVQHVVLIDKIDMLLNKIDEERDYSAIYMGTKNKKDLNNLKFYRASLNKEIRDVKEFLEKNGELSLYQSSINNIAKNLTYIRTRVDVLSADYHNTLSTNYFTKVVEPSVLLIEKLTKANLHQDTTQLFEYLSLLKLKENLAAEKSFISFVLSASKKMNPQDLSLWEHFLDDDITEDIGLKRLRGEVFINSLEGDYPILAKKWIEVSQEKIDNIVGKQQALLNEFKKLIDGEIDAMKYQTTKYMAASIALLVILIILVGIFYRNMENRRMLNDTLSDLEADLDEHQREEIKKVLKQNDTTAIYKFLVNAIKEPSRAKDHFLANMSHEIRTPLNGIIGFTHILKETKLEEDQKEFLNIIEESSNNLISIVNDILDFSKVTSGKVELESIAFNVMEKFESTVDSYAARAAQKHIDLELFIDPNIPTELMGDSTKISQIIINLLSNAIKFTDEYGKVNVNIEKVTQADELVTLKFSVEDAGIGISQDQQDKIFDAFSQADASTSRKFGGTGLGLTISSKFVALMGGKLEVESQEGVGTTFFFSLEFPKVENSKERVTQDFHHINAAYITLKEQQETNENLKTYIEYIGANFKTYSVTEVLNMKSTLLPDILFVDHQYIDDEKMMESLIDLNIKTVLLSTAEIETCNCSIKEHIAKILYKPVNFSRTMRALKLTDTPKMSIHPKVTKINNIHSARVFKNTKALVAEDNIINQKLISNILNNFDITVTIANNGAEALKLREENHYDIIFMDIQMPIMNGIEATKAIIEHEQSHQKPHIPIVALTANTVPSDREKYLASGMDRYLQKPIDVGSLTSILEEYFPLNEIRDSIPLDSQIEVRDDKKSKIILYKETPLTAKIYSAVLNNLGYKVDMYSSEDAFIEHLEKDEYKFALFDAKPFKSINSDDFIIDLIRDSGATPIAFVESDNRSSSCETLKPVEHVKAISQTLKKCG